MLREPLLGIETTLPQPVHSELTGRALRTCVCILLRNCFYTMACRRERLKDACAAFTSEGMANADEFVSMHHRA